LVTSGAEAVEYVLDYLVERKSLVDLLSSIKDGRYRRQKYVAQRSDVRNLIYLCEGQPESPFFIGASSEPERKRIRSALCTTEVQRRSVHIGPPIHCHRCGEDTLPHYHTLPHSRASIHYHRCGKHLYTAGPRILNIPRTYPGSGTTWFG
jgi:hypothetical protein